MNKRDTAYENIRVFCHREGVSRPIDADLDAICVAMQAGRKVEAIKHLRTATAGKTVKFFAPAAVGSAFNTFLSIHGAEDYDEPSTGLGLKDAKDIVDWLQINDLGLAPVW